MNYTVANDRIIDSYFSFLVNLDDYSKKRLIIKLKDSIKEDKEDDLISLFGAWDDTRSSDDIIREIRASRVESSNLEQL